MSLKNIYRTRLYLCLLAVFVSGPDAIAGDNQTYALTNAHIFNGVDQQIISGQTVLVRDGMIERMIGSAADVPADYSVIDCEENYLVPTYITMLEMLEEEYEGTLRLRGTYMVPRLEKVIQQAHALGVPIATGADNYYDAQSVNRISLEVWHLARLGLSPFEALQAATVNAADLLMLGDSTGRIETGFEADMILVPSNPLEDISALQDVLLVMSNGQLALKRIPFARH